MSDDDCMGEDDAFEFEYDDNDNDEGQDVHLENSYYAAKGLGGLASIGLLQAVVDTENLLERGDWGFRSLKQMIKMSFRASPASQSNACLQNVLNYYRILLEYTDTAVAKNYSEKSLNNMLDFMGASTNDFEFLEKIYVMTLERLKITKNDRLWTKTNLKLAKLLLDRRQFSRLTKIIKDLHISCQSNGVDDQNKGTLLMEVFALEILMYTEQKDTQKLKNVYHQCLQIKSAISHPKIMGIIRENGGKMHMRQKEWQKAQEDFFEAFRNYDETGSPQRIACLKYLVLANMLMESVLYSVTKKINPFESQETKPFKTDPQIIAMTDLVAAYQNKQIKEFENILRNNAATIMSDPFIRGYIDELLRNIRSQVLVDLVAPYTRITLDFLSKHLAIKKHEVEELLVTLILDKKINATIDQVSEIVQVNRTEDDINNKQRYQSLIKWAQNIEKTIANISSRAY